MWKQEMPGTQLAVLRQLVALLQMKNKEDFGNPTC